MAPLTQGQWWPGPLTQEPRSLRELYEPGLAPTGLEQALLQFTLPNVYTR